MARGKQTARRIRSLPPALSSFPAPSPRLLALNLQIFCLALSLLGTTLHFNWHGYLPAFICLYATIKLQTTLSAYPELLRHLPDFFLRVTPLLIGTPLRALKHKIWSWISNWRKRVFELSVIEVFGETRGTRNYLRYGWMDHAPLLGAAGWGRRWGRQFVESLVGVLGGIAYLVFELSTLNSFKEELSLSIFGTTRSVVVWYMMHTIYRLYLCAFAFTFMYHPRGSVRHHLFQSPTLPYRKLFYGRNNCVRTRSSQWAAELRWARSNRRRTHFNTLSSLGQPLQRAHSGALESCAYFRRLYSSVPAPGLLIWSPSGEGILSAQAYQETHSKARTTFMSSPPPFTFSEKKSDFAMLNLTEYSKLFVALDLNIFLREMLDIVALRSGQKLAPGSRLLQHRAGQRRETRIKTAYNSHSLQSLALFVIQRYILTLFYLMVRT